MTFYVPKMLHFRLFYLNETTIILNLNQKEYHFKDLAKLSPKKTFKIHNKNII
jgi:hypothetical protein